MKIGLISDIHGEKGSLRRALDILAKADFVLCAGDLIDKGSDGTGVVSMIRKYRIPTAQGNHDEAAHRTQRLRELMGMRPTDPNWLSQETIDILRSFPRRLRLELDDYDLVVSHAAPGSRWDYVWPTSPEATFRRVAKIAPAGVIILGHTHKPMRVDIDGTTIVNPGSVCGAETVGSHTCAIITLPERTFEVYSIHDGSLQEFPSHAY